MPPKQGAKVTPLRDTISRINAAWDIIMGRDWNPGMPIEPATNIEEQTQGPRTFDYPVSANLQIRPRSEYGDLTPFDQLRSLSRLYDVAALCISTRIEQMLGLQWGIKVRKKYVDRNHSYEEQIAEMTNFWLSPDKRNDFSTWLSLVLRDVLEIDALTIYPDRDEEGRLIKFEVIDGATIKVILDDRGRDAAYQQVIKGFPVSDYHRYKLKDEDRLPLESDLEMIYKPRYQRTDSPYGFSPIEQIMMRVNFALRKQSYDMAYFTDGNVPEMLISPPVDKLTADQVKTFEDWFNILMTGDDAARRKIKMIPWPANATMLKSFEYTTVLDEWMMKITCAAFGITPDELGFTDDVNRSTAASQQDVTYRKGIKPLAKWLKDFFDSLIKDLGYPELEWTWEFDEAEDTLNAAKEDDLYIRAGVVTPDEIRQLRYGSKLKGYAPGLIIPPTALPATTPTSETDSQSAAPTNPSNNPETAQTGQEAPPALPTSPTGEVNTIKPAASSAPLEPVSAPNH